MTARRPGVRTIRATASAQPRRAVRRARVVKLDRREQFMAMIARFRKFIVTVAGFIATAAASASDGHVVPSKYMPYVVIFLGICTSYGVYQVRNAPSTPSHEPQPEPMPEPVPMPEPQPEVVIPEPEYPTSSQ